MAYNAWLSLQLRKFNRKSWDLLRISYLDAVDTSIFAHTIQGHTWPLERCDPWSMSSGCTSSQPHSCQNRIWFNENPDFQHLPAVNQIKSRYQSVYVYNKPTYIHPTNLCINQLLFIHCLAGWLLRRFPDAARAFSDAAPAVGESQPVLRAALWSKRAAVDVLNFWSEELLFIKLDKKNILCYIMLWILLALLGDV